MALFWSVVFGEVDQQIEVPTTSIASVRMVAVDVVPGAPIHDGEFVGQLVMWDGAAWNPVPNAGGPTARAEGLRNVNEGAPCELFLGDGFAALNTPEGTSQINGGANVITQVVGQPGFESWQSNFSDGSTFTQILGNSTTITLTANSVGGRISLFSHGVSQEMEDRWSVMLGEGASLVWLDPIVGFLVQVEPGLDISLQNTTGVQHLIEAESQLFRTPDSGGAPQNNLQLSHDVDDPTVGFLGAAPLKRQTITGATTQDQVDSIIAALVAFGLVTDATVDVVQSQIGWAPTVVGQTSNLLELMPAGHAPGLYRVSIAQHVRTLSSGGCGTETLTWSNGGAQSVTTGVTSNAAPRWTVLGLAIATPAAGQIIQYPRVIESDGISAITAQVTANGTIVTPVIDIYASVQR